MKTTNKTQAKALQLRIDSYTAELEDDICRKFPAARRCVLEALADAKSQLGVLTERASMGLA